MREIQALILAAGKSTRMGNGSSKLLYKINNKTIIKRVFESCLIPEISKINIVIGFDGDNIKNEIGNDCNYIVQDIPSGTGHALIRFKEEYKNYHGDLLVLVGDTPFITQEFNKELISQFRKCNTDILFTVSEFKSFIPPYARIIRNDKNKIIHILEDFECSEWQKLIPEVITSQYLMNFNKIAPFLDLVKPKGKNNEFYLNDIIDFSIGNGIKIDIFKAKSSKEVFGINSYEDLKKIESAVL